MFDPLVSGFLLGFIIGLTGALAPGPTLVATINASMTGGWKSGPKVTMGHILSEIGIVMLILIGLSVFLLDYSALIGFIGGTALVIFGILTIRNSRHLNLAATGVVKEMNPYYAGFFTSVLNPYFWIWWFTVGSALFLTAIEGGFLPALLFIAGHWCADLSWLTLISAGIHKGKVFLPDRAYHAILICCGIFLILFGSYFIIIFYPGIPQHVAIPTI